MNNVTPSSLQKILNDYREVTQSQRDSGTLFEELMIKYFKKEPKFESEYETVLTYADWAEKYADELNIPNKKDAGIDLVATNYSGEHHAIQCKNYVPSHKMAKADIDSFMSASGKTYFTYRIIISTVTDWTDNAINMLENQTPPVSTINLSELEQSVIDWDLYYKSHEIKTVEKYDLRPHQQRSHDGVINGLATADRGKLILACGTGKTFTSLRIAETMAGKGKKVLFLVPSLALLSQTLNEWSQQARVPLRNFAVCSDSDIGKTKVSEDDRVIATRSELDFPSTTNAKSLANAIQTRHDDEHMTVVYSTYHSLNVLSDAQMSYNISEFDLIICDEAHRTTGATFEDEDESTFVMVHSDDNIMAKKRLYMTATPRIYSEDAKATNGVSVVSMNNEELFGKELYVINFSTAVSLGLLVDYKVIVLSVEESIINRRLQSLLQDENNQLNVDDAAKIIGCWKALSKQDLEGHGDPMQRAVAFCQVINTDYKGKKHKVSSKLISGMFSEVVEAYQTAEIAALLAENPDTIIPSALTLSCKSKHVDGSMNASKKQEKLDWLKQDLEDNTCHILSNVRCLSEGVDVPALDAVMFMTPRQSQVDVVQSVGRVMRKAPGKTQGYVILPVVVPAGMDPADALDDNQVYKVVWQVLNALRSHDDSFDAMINKLELNGRDTSKMEVIAITDKVQKKKKGGSKGKSKGKGHGIGGGDTSGGDLPEQMTMEFEVGEIERALYAKVVKKCGNRHHWEDWADDISKIANTHIDRIKAILEDESHQKEIQLFNSFASELRDDLNDSISNEEIIEMLAQHLVTKPVFDALFEEYEFAKKNPISVAMQELLDVMQTHSLDKEAKTLQSFYNSVKMRASGIHSAEGKQKIISDLYENFFKKAFPHITKRMGIVYTPPEVIDFIIHSIENVLNDEFDSSLADENVHIIDPFTGTGTFITRLLQSGIIPDDKLAHKYKHEIHANEIVLLAYYIACINIETVYHSVMLGNTTHNAKTNEIGYEPFEGICLTDTFEMYEKEDLISELLEDNSERRKRQKALDIRVIMGNPPYSAGQDSANDDNANVAYPTLDERISSTYSHYSVKTDGKSKLYDSYIRAIRWASDRIGDKGVIGFVTNASFVESNSMDGLRHSLAEEFSNLYIFHLRGNQRTSGERSRKEAGKIFGAGSRSPIAISILVKNPESIKTGQIKLHDIGDYLTREQKLEIITEYRDLDGITSSNGWQDIIPNEFNDWVNQRDPNFNNYIALGNKKNKSPDMFETYSMGIKTNRDAWVYNFSKEKLYSQIKSQINFYNNQAKNLVKLQEADRKDALDLDLKNFKWTSDLLTKVMKGVELKFDKSSIVVTERRPFCKEYLYRNKDLNWTLHLVPKIFPTHTAVNKVIYLVGTGTTKPFSTLMIDKTPDFQLLSNGQGFPLYIYDEIIEKDSLKKSNNLELSLDSSANTYCEEDIVTDESGEHFYKRKDAITDHALNHFSSFYTAQMAGSDKITKEDIFYYVYGILHSEDYRERYGENFSKQLPNIPRVKEYTDFLAFSQAGRKLGELHVYYENVDMYEGVKFNSKLTNIKLADGQNWAKSNVEKDGFYITKMKYAKRKNVETGKSEDDLTKIIYNNSITIENIPEKAYDYVVNGKPAIEWIMERQSQQFDNKSDIANNANDWAIETMDNARYPMELLLRIINVSLKTQQIINELPDLVLE